MATDCPVYLSDWLIDGAATKYRFVKPGATAGKLVAVSAATDRPIGVLYDDVASGETNVPAPVVSVDGSQAFKVEAAAAITANSQVGTGADGRLVAKTGATDIVLGFVREAYAAGEIATVYAGKFDGS